MTTYITAICIGHAEMEISVAYDYTPGERERPRTYADAGEPAQPPEVEILAIKWREDNPDAEWHAAEGPLRKLLIAALGGEDTLREEILDEVGA